MKNLIKRLFCKHEYKKASSEMDQDMMSKKRTVTIKWKELEYVPRYMVVDEEDSDTVYNNIKKRSGIRDLRRI